MLLVYRFLQFLLLALCAGGALAQCRRVGEQVIYLLPNRFVGNVIIVYNRPDGTPAEYRDGARIYRIPTTGVLKTQFKPNYGLRKPDLHYYVDKQGKIIRILPYFNTTREVPTNFLPVDTICFHETPITDSRTPRGYYSVLSIGPIVKADSVFELQDAVIRKL